jgi:hypothetical protein
LQAANAAAPAAIKVKLRIMGPPLVKRSTGRKGTAWFAMTSRAA